MSEAAVNDLDLEEEEEMPEEVPIFDDSDAEYMVEQIRETDALFEKMEAWFTFQIQKAKEKRDRKVERIVQNLRVYFDSVPAKVAKTQKSYDLPSAKLVLKHQEPKYDTVDETLVSWLKQNKMDSLVKVKESPDWVNLKKKLKVTPDGKAMMTEEGEIVPGVTVTAREDKFTVAMK